MGKITQLEGGAVMFEGREAVEVYRATVVASALKLYGKTKLRVNRAYTPTAMLRVAHEITGKKFKRGQYLEASEALTAWAKEARQQLEDAQGAA